MTHKKNPDVLNWNGEFSPKMKKEFGGKLIVIAGGGDGIGASLADGFNALGAKVAILDINTTNADIQSQKLRMARPKQPVTRPYQIDLTDEAKTTEVVHQAVRDAGTAPYAFISTVGKDKRGKFMEAPTEDLLDLVKVNAGGPINAAKAVYKEMRKADTGNGTFIMFSSGHADRITAWDMEGYGAGKDVLEGWTRRLSYFAGSENQNYKGNIRALVFEPGWVQTAQQVRMLEATGADPAAVFGAASKESLIPVGQHPQTVAKSVINLASNNFCLLADARIALNAGEGKVSRPTAIDAGATTGGIERMSSGGHIRVPHPPRKRATHTPPTPTGND